MQNVDLLIHARWLIPVEPEGVVYEHHSLAVDNGRIVAVMPTAEAAQRYQASETVRCDNHAVLPGLVNTHTHAAMSLLRGLADDLPLITWLQEHIWPAEARWVGPEFVRDGVELAIAEMLQSGTTCFNDMYFFPDAVARTASHYGIRASIGLIAINFPSAWAQTPTEYLSKGLALRDSQHHNPLLSFVFAPHAPYTVDDALLREIRKFANELDLPIQMHVHETAQEITDAIKANGKRPLARLAELDLPGPDFMAVHMTQLEAAEIAQLAEAGAHIVHCPESNLKLASGFCPVEKLLRAGVNVALGTDGAASNNDLDMFGEMRSAALLAKGVAGDARAVPASTALRMATLNGAQALGLGEHIGSLETGKWADVIAVDLAHSATQPVYDPISQLVYAANRSQVSDVWVAGRRLLHDRQLTQMNLAAILEKAGQWQARIAAQAGNEAIPA